MMFERSKFLLLLIFSTAAAALILLAAGLPELEFRPGVFFDPRSIDQLGATIREGLRISDNLLVFLLLVLTVLFLLAVFLSTRGEKQLLPRRRRRGELALALLFLLAYLILGRRLERAGGGQQDDLDTGTTPPSSNPLEFPDVANPIDVPVEALTENWLAFGVSFILIALLLVGFLLLWRSRRASETVLDALGEEAKTALEEIRVGGDLRNVILRCYARMCQQISRERGLQRRAAMTPREFEDRLLAAGLPTQPVSQLTRLFESVRYGSKPTGSLEERQAVECLNAILEASQRAT